MATVTKSTIGRFDSLKLWSAALALVALIGCSWVMADHYHIPTLVVFLVWIGLAFIAKVVEDFRGLLKQPSFLLYIIAWLFVHLLVFAVSWLYLTLTEWASAMLLESMLGLFLAHKIFKVPYPGDAEQDH